MAYIKLIAGSILLCLAWAALALYGGFNGWWMDAVAPRGDTRQFMDEAIEMVDGASPGSVAVLLIEGGSTYDAYYRSHGSPVNGETLFPTASLSKWPTAYAVMLLVQEGRIDLDAPISKYLTRWRLPATEFDGEPVTVRRLLSHTAGLVDGLGFGDYSADENLPGLEASLDRPRDSDGEEVRIVVGREPGAEWDYSGGGYLILELLIEEVSGTTFTKYMQKQVFEPLGMSRSNYEYLADRENISNSYERSGEPAAIYQYAAKGATGLSSSAEDLARFALAQVKGKPLTPKWVEGMREPLGYQTGFAIWGAGPMLYSPNGEGDYVFGHDGANDPSINSSVRVNPANGDAIVALSTGPAYLASRIAYQWGLWQTGYPDFIQSNLSIESAMTPLFAGIALIGILTILLLFRATRRSESGGGPKD